MRILIAAVGKVKASPEKQLFDAYIKRLPWKVTCKEIDVKAGNAEQRKIREAEQLLLACEGLDKIIALDETGKNYSSRECADRLGQWQQQGNSLAAFIIGGADGLDESVRRRADVLWSFGRVTWPHMLMRPLLAEQLFRIHSLLINHPYHRD